MRAMMGITLFVGLLMTSFIPINQNTPGQDAVIQGVWNNFDFSMPAEDWSSAAKGYGGENGLIDIVIAQAREDGLVALPFPIKNQGDLISMSEVDLVEPYLEMFDSEGIRVILSIQPLKIEVLQLMDILLSRYGRHESIIGINVDIEWKHTGISIRVTDRERDAWLSKLTAHRSGLKLFLTYFGSYDHFPSDNADMVVLFDGERDTQAQILNRYRDLASHFSSVGLYTGYESSVPPTASFERILETVPKTKFIIHVQPLFHLKPTIIFELDNVQAGWLEPTSFSLMDLHMEKGVPVILGVIPVNLTNPREGTGLMPKRLKNLHINFKDIFEIGQEGYTDDQSGLLRGRSQYDQERIISEGYSILSSIGIEPVTFIPTQGSVDATSVKVLEDRGFKVLISLYETLTSDSLLILNSYVSLTETKDNLTVFKQPDQIMNEILNITDRRAVILHYEINDFQNETNTKIEQLSNIMDALKKSDKYQFMTPIQYNLALAEQIDQQHPQTDNQWQHWLGLASYALVGVLLVMTAILLIKRRRS